MSITYVTLSQLTNILKESWECKAINIELTLNTKDIGTTFDLFLYIFITMSTVSFKDITHNKTDLFIHISNM